MNKDFALDSKRITNADDTLDFIEDGYFTNIFYKEEDVAQKIKEAKKELKEQMRYWDRVFLFEADDIMDKIFKKHFGTLAGDEK